MAGGSSSGANRLLVLGLPAPVLVPVLLAGLGLLRPGSQISDDVRQRAVTALDAAGLGDITVLVSGRDVALGAIPPGKQLAAVDVVSGVAGVRAVGVQGGSEPTARPVPAVDPSAAPTAASPTGGGASVDGVPEADRERLETSLVELTGQAPITFAADSAELTGASAQTVARIAALLRGVPGVSVELDGHVADTPGPAENAQRLSEQRAQVVAGALVAHGVDPARVTARGLADSRPLSTPAASRRVEISIR